MSAIPGDFSVPTTCKCYAIHRNGGLAEPFTITRRAAQAGDVVIGIKFSGICHSDIHKVTEDWGPVAFPMVPGHEIGGIVLAVGSNVTKFVVGERVGVGCMIDSCRECVHCRRGDEQYCKTKPVLTYNDKARYPHCAEFNAEGGGKTFGGYSQTIVVDYRFVVSIPTNLDLAAATPLLCAGITTYSPLVKFGLRPNQRFAVNGLGGLGHMGVKFGIAWGAHTTVISRGTGKKEDSLTNLKAHAFLDSTNAVEMKAAAGTFDFILDTVSAKHDLQALLSLLDTDGKLILVGAPPEPHQFNAFSLLTTRKIISGSLIGGIQETQEMLDFCGRHNITCEIEMIRAEQISEAFARTLASDVKYRFVIDTATI